MIIDDFNGFLKFGKETFPFSFSKNKITIHPTTIDKWKELYIEWFNKDSTSFLIKDDSRSIQLKDTNEIAYFPANKEITYILSTRNNDNEPVADTSNIQTTEAGTIYVITYNYANQSLQLLNTPPQQE